jgi:GNAT superfamily N-acetyltransferase
LHQPLARLITEADIPILVQYRIDYLKELQGVTDVHRETILKKELENHFKTELKANRLFAFLIEENQQPVSFGAVVIKQIPGDFAKSTYFEGDILNMYTVPAFRKKGYAGIILDALIIEAKKREISKLSLHTTKEGEHLYRKTGFAEPVYPYLEMAIKSEAFYH